MQRIKRDFIKKELASLALLLCGMAPLMAYLVLYAGVPFALFLFLPLAALLFTMRMARQAAAGFRQACGVRSQSWEMQVEEEYAAPHPICRVAYGEMHLLSSCLICRHKRRLLFIPADQIAHAEVRCRLVGAKRVPILRLTLESGKVQQIDFSSRRCGDGQKAAEFLTELLGEGRVRLSG